MESLNVNAKNWKALIKPAQLDVKISDDKSHACDLSSLILTSN